MVPLPRNKQALGSLQCDGGNKPAQLTGWNIGRESMIALVSWSSGATCLSQIPPGWAFSLPESGLDPPTMVQWLEETSCRGRFGAC